MRKEVIFAIILGLILGGVIIYGINLANQSANTNQLPTDVTPTPTTNLTPAPTLQVTSPQDHQVIFDDTTTITGRTQPLAYVSIIWEEDETIIQADDQGNFSQEIDLIGGNNQIYLSAANNQDYQESLTFNLVYTTADID